VDGLAPAGPSGNAESLAIRRQRRADVPAVASVLLDAGGQEVELVVEGWLAIRRCHRPQIH
jgi:hypothetical protein